MRVWTPTDLSTDPPTPLSLDPIQTPINTHPTQNNTTQTKNKKQPDFCKGLECPKFTVLKTLPDGIELRRYEGASWASTTANTNDMDSTMRSGFMRLFRYISGDNTAGQRISMTAPVLTTARPGSMTVAFYQPSSLQGAAASSAPKPTAADVALTSTPKMDVWVMPYGGYSNGETAKQKAKELQDKLTKAKETFDASGEYFVAGYDSPMTVIGRRNEIWIPARAPPAAKASGAGRRLMMAL